MKNSVLLCLAFALQLSILQAQPSVGSNQFCENVTFITDHFTEEEKVKGEFVETKESLLTKTDIYAVKLDLDWFNKGIWYNDLMMGPACEYNSERTYSKEEGDNLVLAIKKKLIACLGNKYSLNEAQGISFTSTAEGDDYYSFPSITLGSKELENTPGQYVVFLHFYETIF